MLRSLFAVVCSALSLTLVAGCTQPIDDGSASDTSAVTKQPTGPRWVPPPPVMPRYNAYVGTTPCASIGGETGTWSAALTFPGDSAFCAYTWSGVPSDVDTAALYAGLAAAGVDSASIVRDTACEAELAANTGRTTCTRPTTTAAWIDGGGGGGQYSCRSCVKGSLGAQFVDIVLPQSLITPGATALEGVFKGRRVSFVQPGSVSAFRVEIPTDSKTTAQASATCEDRNAAVLPPWGSVGAPTGAPCKEEL